MWTLHFPGEEIQLRMYENAEIDVSLYSEFHMNLSSLSASKEIIIH